MFFSIKTPSWIQSFYSKYIWKKTTAEKILYLTFDDGPHEEVTPWVLDQLEQHDAKATFFCLGKNVKTSPEIYQRLIMEGHGIGNHGHSHFNGWKTNSKKYIKDFEQAEKFIDTRLFRPPYGKVKRRQAKYILSKGYDIIMWDIIAGDWMQKWSSQKVLRNILNNVEPGSIIVLHDSQKAFEHLKYVLPLILRALKKDGYQFKSL